MRVTLGASAVTLGGLLKHLAWAEEHSFSFKLFGREAAPPWDAVDWRSDPDWEWPTAGEDTPEELFALWQQAVERSRANVAEALTRGDMCQPVHIGDSPGEHANLRRIVVDMIDEYARHNGHADLIRESVNGLVGEDPPPREGE
ncbi:DinB family protein [soil metagenome]